MRMKINSHYCPLKQTKKEHISVTNEECKSCYQKNEPQQWHNIKPQDSPYCQTVQKALEYYEKHPKSKEK